MYNEPNQIGERKYMQEAHESVLRIEQAVINLIVYKARHKKKNTVMGEETWQQLLEHLKEEYVELVGALGYKLDGHGNVFLAENIYKENTLEELGDLYGILVHATLKAGFSMKQVEDRELAKLKERFEYNDQQTTTETKQTFSHELKEYAPVTFEGKQVGTVYIRKGSSEKLDKLLQRQDNETIQRLCPGARIYTTGETHETTTDSEATNRIRTKLERRRIGAIDYLQPHTPAYNWAISSQISENHD